jgi:hypothetical protein
MAAIQLEALLAAAPLLTHVEADVTCAPEQAPRLLRNEPPFGVVRVRRLALEFEEGDAALLPTVCAALPAHASLTSLRLRLVSLAAPATLDAVVDAAIASRLHTLDLVGCGVCPDSAPSLARLLRGGTLRTLHIAGSDVVVLDAPAVALLADALRDSACAVTSLSFCNVCLWDDMAAAAALLTAATAHPRLTVFKCCSNAVPPVHAGAVGASLAALVAGALTELHISNCRLGDAGMAPFVNALAGNTHLRKLSCFCNGISDAFARDVLLPAVRANTSLRKLSTVGADDYNTTSAELDAGALVAARAAAEGAGGAQ